MIKYNNYKINPTIFPDGTSQVWKLDTSAFYCANNGHLIEWEFESESEIFHLMQLVTLIREQREDPKLYLRMDYVPYARQDKNVDNFSTFALKTFADLINTIGFEKIYAFDTHSKKIEELIENVKVRYPVKEIYLTVGKTNADLLCYPDTGAFSKYSKIVEYPFICGHKDRDQKTGFIKNLTIDGNVKDQNVLIIDDICDGGGTFILTAKKLYELGAKSVNLYVSHGLFTKGLGILKESGIKRIFTKDGEVL